MAGETGSGGVQSVVNCCTLDGVELLELIGSGSYAKVYRGEWNGIQVAVKQLHDILQDAGGQDREGLAKTFHKELGMNMELRHPNVIQFLGIIPPHRAVPTAAAGREGQDANKPVPAVRRSRSFPMMVMELMHCTLDARLAEYRENGTRMPFSEVVDTATDIAAALVYLHGRNPPIAHRDLAPKNVLLSAPGTAKLCDLGVAKWASGKSSQKNTEGPGTLPYMPPEVRLGRDYSLLEVDLYSFGVTLLEMGCGLEPNPKQFAHMKEDGSYKLVEERTRREKSFAALGEEHPLLETIDRCLLSTVSKRPTGKQLLGILRGMREDTQYQTSKVETAQQNCSECTKREKNLREIIEKQEKEIAKLRESNKMLESFREEQLKQLKMKLQMAALEGERYQEQLREVEEALDEQIEINRRLEVTNDWANDINALLKQKVEMDSQLHCTKPRSGKYIEKSTSLRYPNESRPKPVPKPRRRQEMSSSLAASQSTDKLDDLCDANSPVTRCPEPPRTLRRRPNISISVCSIPTLMAEQTDEATYLQLDEIAMLKDQKKNAKTGIIGKSRGMKKQKQCTSYENPDDPIYVKFPVTEPPTPPPRDQEFRFLTKHGTLLYNNPSQGPNRLSVIDEKDESMKSPQGLMTPRNKRTTQSIKSPRVKNDSSLLEPNPVFLPRPSFDRQRSRGDVLISEVVSSVKAKGPGNLAAKKGELVKVTNNVIEKNLCIAVKTNGETGTIRKKNLLQVKPVDIKYDSSKPAISSRRGVFDHIARCSSPNDQWVSPVNTMKIIIIPSSLHVGDTGLLVKMTDYLLCCTNDEEESKFDIDLREQRLLKMTGYVLQCHPEENNGAPVHWTMEGSQNGQTWSHLSEESGTYLRRCNTRYFPVTNPTPCRYFRLTQLGRNTEGNYRFCLSGIEFYGQLYSSVVKEKPTEHTA